MAGYVPRNPLFPCKQGYSHIIFLNPKYLSYLQIKISLRFIAIHFYVCVCVYIYIYIYIYIYSVSQEECEILRESVPYVKLYRYNPKHLYPKLNVYGVNGHRKVWASVVSTNCTPSVTQYSSTAQARQGEFFMQ